MSNNFEYEVEVPTTDGKGTETVTLSLRPIAELPMGIVRKNRHDLEGLAWATYEWGLSKEQLKVFDRIPADQFFVIMNAWRASRDEDSDDGADDDASSASE